MWDLSDIIQCPYCQSELSDYRCECCGLQYETKDGMAYLYDPASEHWSKCVAQNKALFRLDYDPNWQPQHDHPEYPYAGVENSHLGQQANAAMFNIARAIITTPLLTSTGYALDLGAKQGWGSMQLSKHKKTVAMDISDHACYGMGHLPVDLGYGIQKIVADGCYMPIKDGTFDIVFMCSTWHHLHDRVKGLNECCRVLRPGGVMVALGEKPLPPEKVEHYMTNSDLEGPPYTMDDLLSIFSESDFEDIRWVPFQYSDDMHNLDSLLLIGFPATNGIIVGRK